MPLPYRESTLGELDTLVVGASGAPLTVVVLHGYGADAFDLLPLCREIDAPRETAWLFPHAPLEVPIGPHVSGRAWFAIDMVALQLAMLSGRAPDLSRAEPPTLAAVVGQVRAAIAAFGAPFERTVLVGFSQGAMIATAVALYAESSPAGLGILSGAPLDAARWQGLAARRSGLPFVQSHGRDDPLLSYDAAVRLHRTLIAAGWKGEFIGFGGGHEVPAEAIRQLGGLITAAARR